MLKLMMQGPTYLKQDQVYKLMKQNVIGEEIKQDN